MNPFVHLKTMSKKKKFVLFLLAGSGLVFGGAAIFLLLVRNWFLVRNWSPPLLPSLFVVGIAVIWLLWKLPRWQVARSKALTDENRFDRENEARKTLAQILAGAFVLAGLYSSVQTFNLSREGQITDRFTKAIEQLGAVDDKGQKKLEVRLGGIYALERIARDSERDHVVVMEVLITYVREHSPHKKGDQKNQETTQVTAQEDEALIAEDTQAILTVLGRREVKYDKERLNLSGMDLHKADLRGANLSWANLSGANFGGANLSGANLSEADLSGANLIGSNLIKANLSGANLLDADLTRATIFLAHLSRATLGRTNLTEAKLGGADLSGADLFGVDLSGVLVLTQEQIDSARGDDDTLLPTGLKMPNSWHHPRGQPPLGELQRDEPQRGRISAGR